MPHPKPRTYKYVSLYSQELSMELRWIRWFWGLIQSLQEARAQEYTWLTSQSHRGKEMKVKPDVVIYTRDWSQTGLGQPELHVRPYLQM